MLVKNNLPTVLDFGCYPNGTKLHSPGTANHGVLIPGIRLLPGTNDVDPEAWEMWTTGRAGHKGTEGKPAGLNWHLSVKNVEVVKVEVEPADADGHSVVKTVSADDFAGLRAEDAIDLARETFDAEMLKAWGDAEHREKDRVTVIDALREQLMLLEAQVADTDGEPII